MQPNKPDSSRNVMRKYYIGVAVLCVGVLAIVVAVLVASSAGRHDRIARRELERAAGDVTSHYDKTQALPVGLQDVYPKNTPKNVTYTTFNNGVFMLCAEFTAQHSGSRSYSGSYDQSAAEAIRSQQQLKEPQAHFMVVGRYDLYRVGNEKGKNCYITQVASDTDIPKMPSIRRESI